MQFVVDTNIIVAALLAAGDTRKLLLSRRFEWYCPEHVKIEIGKHETEFLAKTGMTQKDFLDAQELVFNPIRIVAPEEYLAFKPKAIELTKADHDDWPFFALALQLKCGIWSNDSHFKKQSQIPVYSTKQILETK